jgi:hypothetical protein
MKDHAAQNYIQNDPEYKKYSLVMDKVLQSFDSISEWQDIIGFLSRIHKIVTFYKQFEMIPQKLILAKRLAQCLNPGLPTGVHAKTLQVYKIILERCGVLDVEFRL